MVGKMDGKLGGRGEGGEGSPTKELWVGCVNHSAPPPFSRGWGDVVDRRIFLYRQYVKYRHSFREKQFFSRNFVNLTPVSKYDLRCDNSGPTR